MHDLYYNNGFFESVVDSVIKTQLWNEIYNTTWQSDTQENIYKQIPSWYKSKKKYSVNKDGSDRSTYERLIGKDIFENTPKSLIDIGNNLLFTPQFSFFKKYYKEAKLQYIDMWNGSEEIDFHFDTINGCDTLVLIYLTETMTWDKSWGGTISMKKQVGNDVIFEKEFVPYNGMMLVINNANPLIYHKVTALKNNSINRYTFSFIYKWF